MDKELCNIFPFSTCHFIKILLVCSNFIRKGIRNSPTQICFAYTVKYFSKVEVHYNVIQIKNN